MLRLVGLLLAFCVILAVVTAIDHPEEHVNLLAGSFTDGDRFSTGNTLPLVGRPWGFNHWAPQTRDGSRNTGSWWFKGSDHVFTWLRCTHQPSPWIGDWGWFLFSPMIGPITRNPVHYWEPRGAVLKPHLLDATVAPYGIRMELTPTDHGAYLRVTFPASSASGDHGDRHICFAEARFEGAAEGVNSADGTGRYFEGRATQVNSDRMVVANFALHLHAESAEATRVVSDQGMRCFAYPPTATVVHVRMATSLISAAQALVNLRRELRPKKGFDAVALDAKMVWNKLLRRADVVDAGDVSDSTNRHLDIFYTGLYRALTFPRRIDEVNEHGKLVHYSPYDPRGGVHNGPLVTDNGFWDTFRTVYPMLSLIYPDHLGTIIQGWLNAYKEGGWLPTWASPGYRNCMVGTFADVVIADAIVKDVPGFDLTMAKDALMKDSFEEPPIHSGGSMGKSGLGQYQSLGFIPATNGGGDAVSRTLDYGFADFATAQAFTILATKIGTRDAKASQELRQKASELMRRATRAYSALFDKGQGLMVPRSTHGQVSPGFNAIEWGKGYTEGNAWHHSFPPYAITSTAGVSSVEGGPALDKTLVDLFGSKQALLAQLHKILVIPSNFRVGSYNQEIHEMTEMRALAMGQYGHNNQPSHHIPYLFAVLGDPATTQRTVRTVMERAYGRDFYAGDEDNGEQGAWYVLSALGLYATTPGTPEYVLGSPVFRHVRISRQPEPYDPYYEQSYEQATATANAVAAHGNYLDIIALGTGPGTIYVDQVTLNSAPVAGVTVDDGPLQKGAVLRFIMRGEENSHDIEQRVAEVHLTSTDQLEARLRSTSTSAVPHEDQAEQHQYLQMEHDLRASEEAIAELNKQIAALKVSRSGSGGDGAGGIQAPSRLRSVPLHYGEDRPVSRGSGGGVIYSLCGFLLALLLSVEVLDFMHFVTQPPPSTGSGHSSSGNLYGMEGGFAPAALAVQSGSASHLTVPGSAAARGPSGSNLAGGDVDGFEMITGTSPTEAANKARIAAASDSGLGADADPSKAALAKSLNLDDFASPFKAGQARQTPYNEPNNRSATILSQYLSSRRYGRGALSMVLHAALGFVQAGAEVYGRLYFSIYGRRPRLAAGWLSAAAQQSSSALRRGRKQAVHTV